MGPAGIPTEDVIELHGNTRRVRCMSCNAISSDHEAFSRIEAGDSAQSQDPAALINLGNAYARVGMTQKALSHYRQAMESDTRYELELADGRWMDSRKAARKAYSALIKSTAHVMRE